SKKATIILDSGFFLPRKNKKQRFSEIGYFQCGSQDSDFEVSVDGTTKTFPALRKLAKGYVRPRKACTVEVRHKNKNGTIKKDGIKVSETFHDELLELKDLYGEPVSVEREKFDCVIRFDSGEFSSAGVRKRVFKQHRKMSNGKHALVRGAEPKPIDKPIMHDIVVSFTLNDGESIELARNNMVFWSCKADDLEKEMVLKIRADASTAPKFYSAAFADPRTVYYLPNPDDPPPACPRPPCLEEG
ncbi:MAG: hypothetical protein WAV47_08960, partial [Blastocatellia bacterium]